MPDVTNVTLHCSSSIAALMFADSESSLHRTVCVSSSVFKSFKFLLFIHFCPAPLLDRWAKSNNAKVVIHPRNIDCVMIQWNSLCVCSWTQTGSYTIKWLYKCILHPSIWHLSVFLFFFLSTSSIYVMSFSVSCKVRKCKQIWYWLGVRLPKDMVTALISTVLKTKFNPTDVMTLYIDRQWLIGLQIISPTCADGLDLPW